MGIDMEWTTPMDENVPLGASYQEYEMKPVSMTPSSPKDEVAFEVHFYLADGLHGGKWTWSLEKNHRGQTP